MPAIDIPDPLPPAITPDREVIEFFIDEDLAEFGQDSLVARTWQWVLHGGGPGPISHMNWSRFDGDGPPSAATLAAESTASEPPLRPPTPWDELNRARYICWICTAEPGDELPLRFHPWDAAPAPNATEEGSVTITIRETPATDRPLRTAPPARRG
jgi:hypothetical protein